jgi:hypothetical protein
MNPLRRLYCRALVLRPGMEDYTRFNNYQSDNRGAFLPRVVSCRVVLCVRTHTYVPRPLSPLTHSLSIITTTTPNNFDNNKRPVANDFGTVLEQVLQNRATTTRSTLTLRDVDRLLDNLARCVGRSVGRSVGR